MINFFSGMVFMYVLAMPLMMYISEPIDEEDHNASLRFALLWPLACVEVLYKMIRGDKDDDGTSSN
jgi:hypothetical protein